jgi:deoxyribodipyrimidine photolyase
MKYRVSYELMSTDEAAKDLAALREGKDGDVIFDAVMEVFRKKRNHVR